jgi:hypothetical protein
MRGGDINVGLKITPDKIERKMKDIGEFVEQSVKALLE